VLPANPVVAPRMEQRLARIVTLRIAGCAFLLLAGCRQVPSVPATGRSSIAFVESPAAPPPRSGHAESAEPVVRSQFREAELEKNPALPVYPAKALAARAGRVTVAAHVVVNNRGRVSSVRPSVVSFTTPSRYAEDFWAATEDALGRWRFRPARIEHVEMVTENGFAYDRVMSTEEVEAEFDLAITFSPDGTVNPGNATK
jgi:hypothetical protein